MFGGPRISDLSWRSAVFQAQLSFKRISKEAEKLFWAVEHELEVLVEHMARAKPRLVTSPRHRDRIPIYTASQIGNLYD